MLGIIATLLLVLVILQSVSLTTSARFGKSHESQLSWINCQETLKSKRNRKMSMGTEQTVSANRQKITIAIFCSNKKCAGWTLLFKQIGEHTIKRESTLTTLPQLFKEWHVSFEFRPASYDSSSTNRNTQIFTIGLNQPGVYVISGKKIQFNCNNGEIQQNINELPPIGSWTRLEMKQEKEGSSYFITISMHYAIRAVIFHF